MTSPIQPQAQPITAQKALLKGGDTDPKLLDANTAIFMQNVSGGKHGYSQDPGTYTYTRCEEPCHQWQMAVGGLAPVLAPGDGLIVYHTGDDTAFVGVAAVRKF